MQELKLSGSCERNGGVSYRDWDARRKQLLARLQEWHEDVRIVG